MLIKMQQDTASVSPARINNLRRDFNQQIGMLDAFSMQAVKAKSATQQYTESLSKNEITLKQALRSRQTFNQVLQEQYNLQRMTAVEWSKNASGMMRADVIVPRGAPAEVQKLTSSLGSNLAALSSAKHGTAEYTAAMDVLKMRMGMANQVLGSVAENLVKWGKNTQWAGRQITVGLGVPLAAFAAAAGVTAYHVNQELTRIAKVYDTTATTVAGRQKELADVQANSMKMGIQVARMYGSSLQDTLSVEADLAATGLKNNELLQATAQVQRASILGEMDRQQTVKATIALQSVYKLSSNGLADAFNYMNATENATNLTMQDFVETIPRASGPLKQLGVTLQQTGVLMAAMKSRGIDAAVGANALRSGVYRLLNPTPAAIKMLKSFNISLDDIITNSKGNFYKAMLDLSNQMRGLGNISQQQIVGKLFGIQRAGQLTAIIQALGDIHDKTTQVGRAFQVANQSTDQWGQVAQGEMNQVRQSLSGRLRIAIESFKAQLASMGQPILVLANSLVSLGTGILKFFNSLPGGVKNLALFGAGITAVAGVGLMLTGVMANMAGQGLKVLKAIAGLGSGFKAVTTEQRAEQMLSEQNVQAWQNQGDAALALSKALQNLTLSLEGLVQVQAESRMSSMVPGFTGMGDLPPVPAGNRVGAIGPVLPPIVQTESGAWRRSSGTIYPKEFDPVPGKRLGTTSVGGTIASTAEIAAMKSGAAYSKQIEEETAATGRDWSAIGGRVQKLGIGVGLMGAMVSNGNKLLSTITNIVFAASLLGPTLMKGLKMAAERSAGAGLISRMLGTAKVGTMIASMRGGLATIGTTLLRFAGPIGLLGATAGFIALKINRSMAQVRKDQDAIDNSAKSWAQTLGFVYTEANDAAAATGKAKTSLDVLADNMSKANKPLSDQLVTLRQQVQATHDRVKEQELLNLVMQQGLNVLEHHGSKADAVESMKVSLRIAGFNDKEIQDQLKKLFTNFSFDNQDQVISKQVDTWSATFLKIAQDKFKQGFGEGLWRTVQGAGGTGLNSAANRAAVNMGDSFWNLVVAQTPQRKRALITGLQQNMSDIQNNFWNSLNKDTKGMAARAGINNFAQAYQKYLKDGYQGMAETGFADADIKHIRQYGDAEATVAKQIATHIPSLKTHLDDIHSLKDLYKALSVPTMSAAQAQEAFNKVIDSSNDKWLKMTDAQKLATLNYYREAAGMKDATTWQQGFGAATADATNKIKNQSNAMTQAALTADDFKNALKTTMSGAQEAAFGQADQIWSQYADASSQAIQKAADAQTKALDKAAKVRERDLNAQTHANDHYYTHRINQINDELAAEQRAEERRQAEFEAEKQRLQDLSDMQNKANDFNVAVNTGNLDEAAKTYSEMQNTQDQQAIDVVAKKSQNASDARTKRLQAEIKHLQNLQKEQNKTLASELNRYKRGIDAQKNAIQTKQQADSAANSRFLADQKATLDLQLSVIKASTPRNKAEYDRQISQIESAYAQYGVNLKSYGNEWSGYVGNALKQNIRAAAAGLRDQIDWMNIGNTIGNRFTKGALGLTINQFAKWIETGHLPKGGLNPHRSKQPASYDPHLPHSQQVDAARLHHAHTGGVVGEVNNRGGRSLSGRSHSDEIMVRAKKGEYVVNAAAHKALGTSFLDTVNSMGGGGRPVGLAGLAGGGIAGMMSMAVAMAINQAAQEMQNTMGGAGGGAGGPADMGAFVHTRPSGSLRKWLLKAMGLTNTPTSWLGALTTLVMNESGGNPNNYNPTPVNNGANGIEHAMGLFQTLPSTFEANRLRSLPDNIYNPIANASAGIRYIKGRYHSIYNTPGIKSLAAGGPYLPYDNGGFIQPGLSSVFNGSGKPEPVFTNAQWGTLSRLIDAAVVSATPSHPAGIDHTVPVQYNVNVNFDGATFANDIDVEKAVTSALKKAERRRGPSRKVGTP